ncbi:S-layer protein [Candidatus Woesearchaeota archaeon]|nr:S-layer protein [Candidatus Woesearchaeota archaeon]
MKIRKAIKKIVALSAGATMLGATLMGAMAADLGDYPAPFVTDGVANALVVVGEKAATSDVVGAIDVAASLQAASVSEIRASVSGAGIAVIGGKDAEIAFGATVGINGLGTSIDDGDVAGLLDTKIDFNDDDIDVSESIVIADTVLVLTSEDYDEDFDLDPFVGIPDAGIKYVYSFDDTIVEGDVGTTSGNDTLEIQFLGKSIEITEIAFATGTMTVKASNEYFAAVGDVINTGGHTVTLVNVGNNNAAVVKVDGQTKTVSGGDTTTFDEAGDFKVEVSDMFYVDEKEDRSATLALGDDITSDVETGDCMELFGEPDEDCEWEWLITSQEIAGVYSQDRLDVDDAEDGYGPLGIGNQLTFPNNYAYLSFDSLTETDNEKVNVAFEGGEDLDNGGTSANYDALVFSAGEEIFKVGSEETDTVWLTINPTDNTTQIWYEDESDEMLAAEGNFTIKVDEEMLRVQPPTNWNAVPANITINPPVGATGVDIIYLGVNTVETGKHNDSTGAKTFDSFGSSPDDNDAADLYIGTDSVGSKDTDILTTYGIEIKDPEGQFDSGDEFDFVVPKERVNANLVVGTSATTIAGSSGTVTSDKVNAIGVGLGVLDKDVTVGSQNLIIVGGPCVNTAAAEVMGNPANCADGFSPGKAMLKMFPTNGKTALLVAGYGAQDTQGATRVVAQYDKYDLSGTEASVVVTSLSNIRVE